MNIYISNSVEETKNFAKTFASKLKNGDVVCFKGNLGAGKTQFVQGVANYFDIKENVISPTFNILLQYDAKDITLFHFDLYRLEEEEQLEDIAFYETLESNGISFIEWSEKFPNALPDSYYEVNIEKMSDSSRKITVDIVNNLI